MASFIDRIRGATKGSGQDNGPENAPANPGPLSTGRLIGAGGEARCTRTETTRVWS